MKPVFTTKGKKRYYYYYCDQDSKRAEKCCPVRKIGSATIEDAVRDQAKKIFETIAADSRFLQGFQADLP